MPVLFLKLQNQSEFQSLTYISWVFLIKSKYTLKVIEFKPDTDKLSTLNLNT